jgi:hypothetical protein
MQLFGVEIHSFLLLRFLTDCSTSGLSGARRRNRTVTSCYGPGILSPVRLPVSPSGRAFKPLKTVYQLTART